MYLLCIISGNVAGNINSNFIAIFYLQIINRIYLSARDLFYASMTWMSHGFNDVHINLAILASIIRYWMLNGILLDVDLNSPFYISFLSHFLFVFIIIILLFLKMIIKWIKFAALILQISMCPINLKVFIKGSQERVIIKFL